MKVVILAGGLGTRLKPFTQVIPKPLLPIGDSSVLEIQVTSLVKGGITDIFIASNYRSDYMRAYLGDGSKYGANITFSIEDEPLGTCGPVTLLKEQLTEPFLLMNGDILTTMNFQKLFDFAASREGYLTVVTKMIATPFQFGKVVTEGDYIVDVQEKPNLKLEILAGIYVLEPPLFDLIPDDQYYGIDRLIKEMLARKMKVAKYRLQEYWLDIGQIEDYELAQEAYDKHFKQLND